LRGRVREGGRFACSVDNNLQHASAIPQYVRIPESKHPISFRGQPPIAFDVSVGFSVLAAINLDDKAVLVTSKVNDEWSDWRLSPKAQSAETMRTKCRPQAPFSICHFMAQ
jgi:hypothetical protein